MDSWVWIVGNCETASCAIAVVAIIESDEAIAEETIFLRVLINDMTFRT